MQQDPFSLNLPTLQGDFTSLLPPIPSPLLGPELDIFPTGGGGQRGVGELRVGTQERLLVRLGAQRSPGLEPTTRPARLPPPNLDACSGTALSRPQWSCVLLPFVARTGMSVSLAGVGEESKISISPRCGSVWRMPWGGWLRGQHLGEGVVVGGVGRGSGGVSGRGGGHRGGLREGMGAPRGSGLEGWGLRKGGNSEWDRLQRGTIGWQSSLPPTPVRQAGGGRLTHLAASPPRLPLMSALGFGRQPSPPRLRLRLSLPPQPLIIYWGCSLVQSAPLICSCVCLQQRGEDSGPQNMPSLPLAPYTPRAGETKAPSSLLCSSAPAPSRGL